MLVAVLAACGGDGGAVAEGGGVASAREWRPLAPATLERTEVAGRRVADMPDGLNHAAIEYLDLRG